jgi:hypothetical protein
MLTQLVVIFVVSVFVFAQASDTNTNHLPVKTISTQSSDEIENIAEVVFRWQLFWNKQEKVAFLLLNGREPSEKFFARLKDQQQPRVQKSDRKKRDDHGRIIDSDSGEVAEIISIGPITWVSKTEVDVRSNVYDGDVGEYVHRLTLSGGKWAIEDWRDLADNDGPRRP